MTGITTGLLLAAEGAASGGGWQAVVQSLVIALGVCLVTSFICSRIKVPSVVGLLVAGVAVGPGGIGLIQGGPATVALAEIGLVFLMFAIGLGLPVQDMKTMRRAVFGGGGLQVGLTTLALALPLALLGEEVVGLTVGQSIFAGLLLAQSSTAVMLNVMDRRGESNSPAAKVGLSVSIFQDVTSIPIILFIPVMAGQAAGVTDVAVIVGKSVLAIAVVFVLAKVLLPRFFDAVVRTRSQEVFSFATVAVIMGVAFFSGMLGLSLTLGAFLAGVVVAESDVARQVLADIRLIRDNLVGLFFVSVGLLLDPRVFVDHGPVIIGLALAAMLVKGAIMIAVGMGLGFGVRTSVGTGILNAQIGEFAFVLASVARKLEQDTGLALFPPGTYEPFVAVAILTMVLMPGCLRFWAPLSAWIERRSVFRAFRRSRLDRDLGALPGGSARTSVNSHVVVIGYGLSGKNVVRMLKAVDIPVIVIEMNPHTVRAERAKGTMIFFGDASRPEVLSHAGVARAKAVVVTIPDAAAAEAAVQAARTCSPDAYIVVRTRYVREVPRLRALGANSVVPEEFETSLELASQSMEVMGASEWGIAQQKHIIREDQYRLLLEGMGADSGGAVKCSNLLPLSVLLSSDMAVVSLAPGSPGIGATLAGLDLRRTTGASVVGIARGSDTIRGPGGDLTLQENDVVYLFGSSDELDAARIALAGEGHEPMPSEGRRTARKIKAAERGSADAPGAVQGAPVPK